MVSMYTIVCSALYITLYNQQLAGVFYVLSVADSLCVSHDSRSKALPCKRRVVPEAGRHHIVTNITYFHCE